jgi:hypothetical protein
MKIIYTIGWLFLIQFSWGQEKYQINGLVKTVSIITYNYRITDSVPLIVEKHDSTHLIIDNNRYILELTTTHFNLKEAIDSKIMTTYTYDNNHNIIERLTTDVQGNIQNRYTRRFDEKGNILEENNFEPTIPIRSYSFTYRYLYAKNGLITQYDKTSKELIFEQKNKYDSTNKLIESTQRDASYKIISKSMYNYSISGKTITTRNYKTGIGDTKQITSYDNKENMIEQDLYTNKDEIPKLSTKTSFKYDSNNNKLEFKRFSAVGKLLDSEISKFNANNVLIECKKCNQDTSRCSTAKFNSNGDIIYKDYNEYLNVLRNTVHETYTYVYDSKSNWILSNKFLNNAQIQKTVRIIEYY